MCYAISFAAKKNSRERKVTSNLSTSLTTCQELAILKVIWKNWERIVMRTIQVGKLKAEFSSVLEKIQSNGEKFIIEYGKKHRKVAMLIPYDESFEKEEERKFGILKNKASFKITDDFTITDEELLGL